MTNTMTPNEIAEWLDIEANTLGHVPMLAGDAPYLRQAAATIRELESRLNDRNQRLEDLGLAAEGESQTKNEAVALLRANMMYPDDGKTVRETHDFLARIDGNHQPASDANPSQSRL